MIKALLRMLLLLCIVGIIYSLFHIISYKNEYKVADEKYMNLQNVHAETTEDSFKKLSLINKDYVGWLTLDGTNINYPVVQNDNNEYYLNHNFYQEEDKVGAIFMDYRNKNIDTDDHTIIYGHYMKDESMFRTLENVLEDDFENKHITYEVEGIEYEWEIFSAYVTEETDWMQIDFNSTREFKDFKTDLIHNSEKDFNQQLDDEKILTLATCTTINIDERTVVHAKLIEKD